MNRKQLSILIFSALIGTVSFPTNAAKVGENIPMFTLPTLQQNRPTSLQDFQGKVVYLDFWVVYKLRGYDRMCE